MELIKNIVKAGIVGGVVLLLAEIHAKAANDRRLDKYIIERQNDILSTRD